MLQILKIGKRIFSTLYYQKVETVSEEKKTKT